MSREDGPLGTWDADDPSWTAGLDMLRQRYEWAREHIGRADDTYRIEFELVDAPFATVYRYKRNEAGLIYLDTEKSGAAIEEPVTQLLAGLPPAHLLAG